MVLIVVQNIKQTPNSSKVKRGRLLYACAQLPWPQDSGHKIVSYNDISHLSSCFDIDVISFYDPKTTQDIFSSLNLLKRRFPRVKFLPPIEHTIHKGSSLLIKVYWFCKSFLSGYPYIVYKYRNKHYLANMTSALRKQVYNGVYIESTPLGYLLKELNPILISKTTVIFRPHDSLTETLIKYSRHAGWRATCIAAKIDSRRCKSFEKYLWKTSDIILPVTKRLKSIIVQSSPEISGKIKYFPVSIEPLIRKFKVRNYARTVLYIGTIHYPPNRQGLEWFMQHCWPQVTDEINDARLIVVGKGGKELSVRDKNIDIREYVTDLESVYNEADVFIVPLFAGSGIRLKILDSMKNGLPIVSTTAGYLGLEITENEELLVANSAGNFAKNVIRLLKDPPFRISLIDKGQSFIKQYHSDLLAKKIVRELSASI